MQYSPSIESADAMDAFCILGIFEFARFSTNLGRVFTMSHEPQHNALETDSSTSIEHVAKVLSRIFAPESLAAIPEGEKGYDPKYRTRCEYLLSSRFPFKYCPFTNNLCH